jgi:tRNA 2-thiocytidine biosynthesis protein TtcA
MPPRLTADDGRNVVIRPLAYVSEAETRAFASERGYPIVRCGCLSCGLPDQKRQVIKRLLVQLEADNAGLKRQMLAALRNVKPDHLLDTGLLARLGLGPGAIGTVGPDFQDASPDTSPETSTDGSVAAPTDAAAPGKRAHPSPDNLLD